MNWHNKEVWTRRGDGFTVEVSRYWFYPSSYYRDPDDTWYNEAQKEARWYIYVHFLKDSKFFNLLKECQKVNAVNQILPQSLLDLFHGGLTYFNNTEESIQIGCDYYHYGDDAYLSMHTAQEANAVFKDAEQIYRYLLTSDTSPV